MPTESIERQSRLSEKTSKKANSISFKISNNLPVDIDVINNAVKESFLRMLFFVAKRGQALGWLNYPDTHSTWCVQE